MSFNAIVGRWAGGGFLGDQGLWNETLLLQGPFTHLSKQQDNKAPWEKNAFLPQGHTYVHANKQEGVGTHRNPKSTHLWEEREKGPEPRLEPSDFHLIFSV